MAEALQDATYDYAGFWRRVLAFILDQLIIGVAVSIVAYAVAGGDFDSPMFDTDGDPSDALTLVAAWLYYAFQESSAQQTTLGKRALGIIVSDTSGRRLSFGRATGRHFAKYLSVITLGIGFIMVAFTRRKQGLHDLLAETLVLHRTSPAHAGPTVNIPEPA